MSAMLDTSTSSTAASQKPAPPEPLEDKLSEDIIDKLDTDGDGELSTEELEGYSELADADTDEDGVVSKEELVAKLKTKMEEMGMTPPPPPEEGEEPDVTEMVNQAAEEMGTEGAQNGADMVSQLLTNLGFSEDDVDSFMSMMGGVDAEV